MVAIVVLHLRQPNALAFVSSKSPQDMHEMSNEVGASCSFVSSLKHQIGLPCIVGTAISERHFVRMRPFSSQHSS